MEAQIYILDILLRPLGFDRSQPEVQASIHVVVWALVSILFPSLRFELWIQGFKQASNKSNESNFSPKSFCFPPHVGIKKKMRTFRALPDRLHSLKSLYEIFEIEIG